MLKIGTLRPFGINNVFLRFGGNSSAKIDIEWWIALIFVIYNRNFMSKINLTTFDSSTHRITHSPPPPQTNISARSSHSRKQIWTEFRLFWEKWSERGLNWSIKVWFSAKVAYLSTCPEYENGTFIPAETLDNLKAKLWKSLIFGPILVWFYHK